METIGYLGQVDRLLGAPATGYIACAEAVRDRDQRSLLDKIVAPTLVIEGTRDPATPPTHLKYLRHHIHGARLIALEAAHLSNFEATSAFDAALLGFLKETPPQ